MIMVAFALFVGFLFGALAVIGVQVLGLLLLIRKLGGKVNGEDVKPAKFGLSGGEELDFSFPDKQGWVWVLEKEKIPKTSSAIDKGLRQQKRKIEVLEVSPVRKYVNIKDQSLIVTEPDGTLTQISLLGCTVEAVSATHLPSRKWAKKYPVKVESNSVVYHGSKLFYIYFDTSSEKESWCLALRLASCEDKEKLKWFGKSRSDFHRYLSSLNVEYPAFLKPSIGFNPEVGDKSVKIDGSSSRVRNFWNKLIKKTSKSSVENKTNWWALSAREDKKITEGNGATQESSSVGSSLRSSQTQKKPSHAMEEKVVEALMARSMPSVSRNQGLLSSDADSNEKVATDDGTLCCSLLISRLFFDAKGSVELNKSIQARIQRTLSSIRIPSYVGEITCTGVNLGNAPPYIHGMRVLPSDLKEVVAMEIDIEYYGGAVLNIETRLEVQELENPTGSDSKSVDDVKKDLLEGVEYYGEQLKLGERTIQSVEQNGDKTRKLEETKSFKGNEEASSTVPKWKSMLNSVAKQVSQVPLSLAIGVTTLRGTLRVHIKPPPSDQLWFGFTSMPDIDFSLESSVGDHKIASGHIALFIISKFKAAIRETMVLPNSESVTIPFMKADKNNWIPQKVAPYIWNNPELNTERTTVHLPQEPQEENEVRTSSTRSTDSTMDKITESFDDQTYADENAPSLENEEFGSQSIKENREVSFPDWQHPSPPKKMEENGETVEEDGDGLQRIGTRAKMLGLRKKMREKMEEKRRNIEEKGRHIVGKMRESR